MFSCSSLKCSTQLRERVSHKEKQNDKREEYELAGHHYREALRLNPDYHIANFNVALNRRLLGDFELAIGHYERLLERYPGFLRAYENVGGLLERQGRTSEAARHYEAVIRLDPDDFVTRQRLRRLRSRMDR